MIYKKDNKNRYWISEFINKFMNYYQEHVYIALILKIDFDEYKNYLCNDFNGKIYYNHYININGDEQKIELIYFETEKDIKAAIEWIESLLVLKALEA